MGNIYPVWAILSSKRCFADALLFLKHFGLREGVAMNRYHWLAACVVAYAVCAGLNGQMLAAAVARMLSN